MGETEGDAGDAEQEQPGDHCAARPEPGSHQPRRQREDQGAGRVGRREHARLRLAQPEVGDVIGQQRRDCREEDDVEEDHRRGEYEQSTHCRQYNHLERSQSWAVASSIGGSPTPRRGGRAVECTGLENRQASKGVSRVRIPPPPLCDVSRHRRQMSRDIVDTSESSDRLVVATGIEGQPADQLTRLGVEDANVAIGDEQLDRLSLVSSAEADVVKL